MNNIDEKTMDHFNSAPGDTILNIVRGDIHELRSDVKAYQTDTKEEFLRIRDKIDSLHQQFFTEARSTSLERKSLEIKHEALAERAGRYAGAVAGFITSLVLMLIGVGAKYLLGIL